jgi:hypothetical protein
MDSLQSPQTIQVKRVQLVARGTSWWWLFAAPDVKMEQHATCIIATSSQKQKTRVRKMSESFDP